MIGVKAPARRRAHDAPMPSHAPLPPLVLKGRALKPVVQGGMGVGISAHRLAGSVAAENALGTIASVDLRRHHDDLLGDPSELAALLATGAERALRQSSAVLARAKEAVGLASARLSP